MILSNDNLKLPLQFLLGLVTSTTLPRTVEPHGKTWPLIVISLSVVALNCSPTLACFALITSFIVNWSVGIVTFVSLSTNVFPPKSWLAVLVDLSYPPARRIPCNIELASARVVLSFGLI